MTKAKRRLKGDIVAWWRDRTDGLWCDWKEPGTRATCNLVLYELAGRKNEDGRSFIRELEHRGYDLRTLRFSIDKMPTSTPSDRQGGQ